MFATLLEAARRAPSGDNTQPWQFVVAPAQPTIELRVDATRDTSPMNAGQRMARIAIGAAMENIFQTAAANSWTVSVVEPFEPARATLHVVGDRDMYGTIKPALYRRCSNRRLYDGGSLPVESVEGLRRALAPRSRVRTVWITERDCIEQAADVVGEADALMFASQRVRRAFFEKIRFDAPARAEVAEGLSLGSLELSLADRMALPLLPRLSERWFVWGGGQRALRHKARKLVRSSSGLLLVGREDRFECDYEVGRTLQAGWLALAELGICAQPMMSLPVLQNLQTHDESFRRDSVFCAEVDSLGRRFLSAIDQPEFGYVGALLRFGRAAEPTGRVGRRDFVDEFIPNVGGMTKNTVA